MEGLLQGWKDHWSFLGNAALKTKTVNVVGKMLAPSIVSLLVFYLFLPLYMPWLPVDARAYSSSCCAPSCIARSASSWHRLALIRPWLHRASSLFASWLCEPLLPFARVCFIDFKGAQPVSLSNSNPLTLLAMATFLQRLNLFCKV